MCPKSGQGRTHSQSNALDVRDPATASARNLPEREHRGCDAEEQAVDGEKEGDAHRYPRRQEGEDEADDREEDGGAYPVVGLGVRLVRIPRADEPAVFHHVSFVVDISAYVMRSGRAGGSPASSWGSIERSGPASQASGSCPRRSARTTSTPVSVPRTRRRRGLEAK